MITNINTVRWYDSKNAVWVTDYHSDDAENPCIITSRNADASTDKQQYSFCMSKKLAEDIHALLEQGLKIIHCGKEWADRIHVMNLSLNSNTDFVSGKFSICIQDERN